MSACAQPLCDDHETSCKPALLLLMLSALCVHFVLKTGKYSADGPRPVGYRSKTHTEEHLRTIAPLLSTLQAVAAEREKSTTQVCLAIMTWSTQCLHAVTSIIFECHHIIL